MLHSNALFNSSQYFVLACVWRRMPPCLFDGSLLVGPHHQRHHLKTSKSNATGAGIVVLAIGCVFVKDIRHYCGQILHRRKHRILSAAQLPGALSPCIFLERRAGHFLVAVLVGVHSQLMSNLSAVVPSAGVER